ncbi:MAG: hypothetical protein U0800_20235 [Isosphaeraceae bacterium]
MNLRVPRFRLATMGFLVLLAAVDFSLVRTIFAIQDTSLYLVLLLTPAMNLAAFDLYRLLDPSRRTARLAGRSVGGWLAIGAMALASLAATDAFLEVLRATLVPIVINPFDRFLQFCVGNPLLNTGRGVYVRGILLEAVIPSAFFGLVAFLAGRIGGWLATRIRPSGPPPKPLPA